MEKISTNYSRINIIPNKQQDELAELKSLLNDESYNLGEVNNYLDSLKKDINEDSVQKIIEFARQYRETIKKQENIEIR